MTLQDIAKDRKRRKKQQPEVKLIPHFSHETNLYCPYCKANVKITIRIFEDRMNIALNKMNVKAK